MKEENKKFEKELTLDIKNFILSVKVPTVLSNESNK